MAREWKRRRLLETHPLRDALQIGRRDLAILRVASVELATEPLLTLAVLVAPLHARRAGTALNPVLDDDAFALFPPRHPRTEARDLAGDVEPEDARQPTRRRASGADRQVRVVDGGAPDANEDFARPRVGIGTIAEGELLGAAWLGDVDGFHRKTAMHLGALNIQVSAQSTSSILWPSSAAAPERHTQLRISCWPEASSCCRGVSRQAS